MSRTSAANRRLRKERRTNRLTRRARQVPPSPTGTAIVQTCPGIVAYVPRCLLRWMVNGWTRVALALTGSTCLVLCATAPSASFASSRPLVWPSWTALRLLAPSQEGVVLVLVSAGVLLLLSPFQMWPVSPAATAGAVRKTTTNQEANVKEHTHRVAAPQKHSLPEEHGTVDVRRQTSRSVASRDTLLGQHDSAGEATEDDGDDDGDGYVEMHAPRRGQSGTSRQYVTQERKMLGADRNADYSRNDHSQQRRGGSRGGSHGRSGHGRFGGRGGFRQGDNITGDRIDFDGCDRGRPVLGRRGSGRSRGRGRGRGSPFGDARGGHQARPLDPRRPPLMRASAAAENVARAVADAAVSTGKTAVTTLTTTSATAVIATAEAVQQVARAMSQAASKAKTTKLLPPVQPAGGTSEASPPPPSIQPPPPPPPLPQVGTPRVVSTPGETTAITNEQIRRARRKERAVLIFQEQIQQQQAEAVARQERAQANAAPGSASVSALSPRVALPLALLTALPPPLECTPTSASTAPSVQQSAVGRKGSMRQCPTTNNTPLAPNSPSKTLSTFTQTTDAATTIIETARTKYRVITASEAYESVPLNGKGDNPTPSNVPKPGSGVFGVLKMANFKMNELLGSDADDGNDSDDLGSDFIMTRTAGKRRGNLSAADMLANEILHDINEDLTAAAEDKEEADPIKRMHRGYMNEAVAMAQLALRTNETPVGCVLVHNGRVIARGMNATNMTRNGTRHAELMCLNSLLSYWDEVDKNEEAPNAEDDESDCGSAQDYDDDKMDYTEVDWEKVDPSKGHLFPYGQKLHPARIVNPDIIRECSLYVTVEPCIMCASMLRQYGIKKVYFGAANDKFGGTGGVLRIHMNSKPDNPTPPDTTYIDTYITNMMSRPKRARAPRPPTERNGDGTAPEAEPPALTETPNPPVVRRASTIPIAEGSVPARDEGHGGNVEPGFDVEGGWGRNKAVFLLRQFYVQENGRAPAPRKKEGRAQRLVQQMKSESESSSVKLPSSAEGHLAEIEAELDSLPLAASKTPMAENAENTENNENADPLADVTTSIALDNATTGTNETGNASDD